MVEGAPGFRCHNAGCFLIVGPASRSPVSANCSQCHLSDLAIKAANSKASTNAQPEESKAPEHPCPCCGTRMLIIETFLRGQQPKHRPTPGPPAIRIDTSDADTARHLHSPSPPVLARARGTAFGNRDYRSQGRVETIPGCDEVPLIKSKRFRRAASKSFGAKLRI
jgi:hypothetical protein